MHGFDCLSTPIDSEQMTLSTGSSRKRPRSPSPTPMPTPTPTLTPTDTRPQPPPRDDYQRQPKRQRKNREVPSYDAPPEEHVLKRMARSNPLSRRVLKQEAKRARKAARIRSGGGVEGMEIDDEGGGLEFTFMA